MRRTGQPSGPAGRSPARLPGQINLLSHLLAEQAFWGLFRPAISRWRREHGQHAAPLLGPFRGWRADGHQFVYGSSPSLLPKPPDWGANDHVTGAWLLDSPAQARLSDELEAFLAAGPPPCDRRGRARRSARDPGLRLGRARRGAALRAHPRRTAARAQGRRRPRRAARGTELRTPSRRRSSPGARCSHAVRAVPRPVRAGRPEDVAEAPGRRRRSHRRASTRFKGRRPNQRVGPREERRGTRLHTLGYWVELRFEEADPHAHSATRVASSPSVEGPVTSRLPEGRYPPCSRCCRHGRHPRALAELTQQSLADALRPGERSAAAATPVRALTT